jgi:hypothetical protein
MEKLRSMPEREKFQHAFEMVRLYQRHVLPFVEQHLGYAEMHNLRSIWQAAIIPIHEEIPDFEKYNQAYNNWLWLARCSHDLLAEKLCGEEVLDYKRLLLRLYEQKLNNPDLFILRALGAHGSMARALLYEMQWLTPLEITNFSKGEITCVIHECRLLLTPGVERVCRVDCQNVGAAYARKAFHLKRMTTRSNHGCTIKLTPIPTETG